MLPGGAEGNGMESAVADLWDGFGDFFQAVSTGQDALLRRRLRGNIFASFKHGSSCLHRITEFVKECAIECERNRMLTKSLIMIMACRFLTVGVFFCADHGFRGPYDVRDRF
ncbi:unnamed protein product [Ostreobium quekettii]|uniref:Uncharacterized protein n=1 Tax=Ostreobium quekettii TaxID=121088 RepID=A0A8S1J206_9CHLO|nr:unnamed protein product [Ostreobium quekettii]